jgi:hypothetical protein
VTVINPAPIPLRVLLLSAGRGNFDKPLALPHFGGRFSIPIVVALCLRGASLEGAILHRADFSGVSGITNEELAGQAVALEGAIMPDASNQLLI